MRIRAAHNSLTSAARRLPDHSLRKRRLGSIPVLANATTEGTGAEAKRTLVSILQDFGPLEAKLLHMIYHAPLTEEKSIMTGGFPETYMESAEENPNLLPSDEAALALWNLCRLGCIEPAGT